MLGRSTQLWVPGALILVVLLGGCDSGDLVETGTVGKAEVGRIPAYPQRPGDPAKGYDALLNRAAVTCGPPYMAYVKARGEATRDPGPQPPGRSGRNAELPYGLTAAPGPVRGGAGDHQLSELPRRHDRRQARHGPRQRLPGPHPGSPARRGVGGDPVSGVAETAEWRRWADRVGAIADYLMTDTIGVSSANNLTLALMAHRDPETLAWSDRPLIDPLPQHPLPVGVPPWWNMGKQHALFYSGEGRGDDVRYLMLASTICTDSVEEARSLDAWFVDVRAYLATLEPPRYPYPVDRPLADRGQSLFQANCKTCHGTYGEERRYPNKVVALGKVGTDPELARAGYSDSDRFLDWLQHSFTGSWPTPPRPWVMWPRPWMGSGRPPLTCTTRCPPWPICWRARSGPAFWESGGAQDGASSMIRSGSAGATKSCGRASPVQ